MTTSLPYRLRLAGRFELLSPQGAPIAITARKTQALIAVLALARGEPVARSRLCALLWEDRGEAQARGSLRQALAVLRRILGPHGSFPLVVTEETAAIDASAVSVDLWDHETADAGQKAGEFLEGLDLDGSQLAQWLAGERQALATRAVERLAREIAAREAASDPAGQLAAAQALLQLDPLNEAGHRSLMRAHVAGGDRSRALRHYQEIGRLLKSELDVEPDPETRALYEQIRHNGATTAAPPPAPLAESDHPSLVVLPFANLTGDPRQDYFCGGLTETVTSELARFHDLLVIASASALTYTGARPPVPQICASLGVAFALEGSVQRSGIRKRISTQLIEAATGRQVWSERYDRESDDDLAIQCEIASFIAGTLATTYGGRLRRAWRNRAMPASRPRDARAHDLFMKGLDVADGFTPENMAKSREFFRGALELEPGYVKPMTKLGWCDLLDIIMGWSDDFDAKLAEAYRWAEKALAADAGEGWGYWIMAACHLFDGKHEVALAELERALEFNPNDADILADYGLFLGYAGEADRGHAAALKAMKLNPHNPHWYNLQLVQLQFERRDYAAALKTFAGLHGTTPTVVLIYAAACHAALGQMAESQAVVARTLASDPAASISKYLSPRLAPYRRAEDREHLRNLLIRAGLPAG
jgi:TolB-like protein/DNA-binding SARP family transcriptional activator/Tfp pilus assembly protein PilF